LIQNFYMDTQDAQDKNCKSCVSCSSMLNFFDRFGVVMKSCMIFPAAYFSRIFC